MTLAKPYELSLVSRTLTVEGEGSKQSSDLHTHDVACTQVCTHTNNKNITILKINKTMYSLKMETNVLKVPTPSFQVGMVVMWSRLQNTTYRFSVKHSVQPLKIKHGGKVMTQNSVVDYEM